VEKKTEGTRILEKKRGNIEERKERTRREK